MTTKDIHKRKEKVHTENKRFKVKPIKSPPTPQSTQYTVLDDDKVVVEEATKKNQSERDSDIPHFDLRNSPSLKRFEPVDKIRESLLTKPELLNLNNGTVNFAVVCFVVGTMTLMADRYRATGEFIDFSLMRWLVQDWIISLILWGSMSVWCVVVWGWTYLGVKGYINDWVASIAYVLCVISVFVYPITVVVLKSMSPLLGMVTSMQICVHAMKMHSYWVTNFTLHRYYKKHPEKSHQLKKNHNKEKYQSPNVDFWPFFYFLVAPTLVFASDYPRSEKIRPHYIVLELFKGLLCFLVGYVLITDCLIPFYRQTHVLPFWYILIKLSLPSMSLWMVCFYGLFHCILNIFAELTRFGDREFYQDWWNATSFDMWWRKWNRPVHRWMVRHIYTDSMHTVNFNKFWATISTFLLSAVLHEFCLIVAFRVKRPVLSSTMILQIGLIYITQLKFLQDTPFGNLVVWFSLLIGQPLIQILYCWEYFQEQNKIE